MVNIKLDSAQQIGTDLTDLDVEKLIKSGQHDELLAEYFGQKQLLELKNLLKSSERKIIRGATKVLILPGIMGSKLDVKEKKSSNTIWIDILDILRGELIRLSPDSGEEVVPSGVILYTYLKLKLTLQFYGYDAEFLPFDWRLSTEELGEYVLETVDGKETMIVAHSMGGLVARVAAGLDDKKFIKRVIMLGTPNYGSYSPVQTFRGTASLVRWLGRLDWTRPLKLEST